MKNQFKLIAVCALFALSSCKKDRTCKCESTSSYTEVDNQGQTQSYNPEPRTTTIEYKKVTKADLRFQCSEMNSTYTSTDVDGKSTSTYETKCEIE